MNRNLAGIIWLCTLVIVGVGLMALYSASYQNIRISNEVFYDQLLFAAVGFTIMFLLSCVDYRNFYDLSYILHGMSIVLLVLVLVAGRHALGATRWFSIAGISFQPSELAKFALILALARYFADQ